MSYDFDTHDPQTLITVYSNNSKTVKNYESEATAGMYIPPEGVTEFQISEKLLYFTGGCSYKHMKSASVSDKLFQVKLKTYEKSSNNIEIDSILMLNKSSSKIQTMSFGRYGACSLVSSDSDTIGFVIGGLYIQVWNYFCLEDNIKYLELVLEM